MKTFSSSNIRYWYLPKVETPHFCCNLSPNVEIKVENETEKAYFVSFYVETLTGSKDIQVKVWMPKSVIMSDEEKEADDKAYEEKRRTKNYYRKPKKEVEEPVMSEQTSSFFD